MDARCVRTEYRLLRPDGSETDRQQDLMLDVEAAGETITLRIGGVFRKTFGMLNKPRRQAIVATMPPTVRLEPTNGRKGSPVYRLHDDDLAEWRQEAERVLQAQQEPFLVSDRVW